MLRWAVLKAALVVNETIVYFMLGQADPNTRHLLKYSYKM